MTTTTKNELKASMFSEAIQRSSVALRKGANVCVVDGKISYTIEGQKTSGSYKMRSNYREVLCMLQHDDIKKIMAL
jgi:activator of HSP90 ATPase